MSQCPHTSLMRKADLLQEICQWDEDGKHMTVEMLRARIRQIYQAMDMNGKPPPRHKKKDELMATARDLGYALSGQETRGDLQIMIVEKFESRPKLGAATDVVPFGRHRGLTFQELLVKEKEYAGWSVSLKDRRFHKLTNWLTSQGVKEEDMMNVGRFELPVPEVKGEKYEKQEGPWLVIREENKSTMRTRPTTKRLSAEEPVKMEDVKAKEDQIIDLFGDMKNQMHALTSRVQKVEEASSSTPGPLKNITDSQATWLAGCLDKSVMPARTFLTDTVFRECDMQPAICDGCMVGVKARDTGLAIQKPWETWTTSDRLRQRMAIRCDGKHDHSPCVGGHRTAATACYPDEFVRRAVRAMLVKPNLKEINGYVESEQAELDFEMSFGLAKSEQDIDRETMNKIEIAARRIHSACGHCPFSQVAKSLAAKGADKRIVDHVKSMRCAACDESQKNGPPRPVGSADEVRKKWAVLQSDLAEWECPVTHEKFKLVLYLDMGSRLGVGHMLFKMEKSRNATAEDLKNSVWIWSRWISYFGRPRVFQVDPEGAWMSNVIRENLESSGIQMDPIPGQAHWQIGGIERLIGMIKDTMMTLAKEHPGRTCEEYLARSMAAYNEFDRHRGFSPLQVALGRAPDLDGSFIEVPGDPVNLPALESEAVDAEFGNNFEFMRKAQEALLKWIYGERARRAVNARSRKLKVYTPGTLGYYFRHPKSSSMTGRFYGPARVLATETVHRNGSVQPRPRVWLNACGRLIRCDPCQLRDASDREIAEHEIIHGTELPWTFSNMTGSLKTGQYEDLADDPKLVPSDKDYVESKKLKLYPDYVCVESEVQSNTGSAHFDGNSSKLDSPDDGENVPSNTGTPTKQFQDAFHESITYGKEKTDRQKRHDSKEQEALGTEETDQECFWNQADSAIEIEISMPSGAKGGYAARDLGAFVATQLRRQRAEKAKSKEAQEWIKEMVLEALPPHVKAPMDRLMRLRWVLTWKIDPTEPGGRKAKARLVILGFQDPDLTTEESYAPTATRTARQVFLQKAAHLRMRVAKGDGEELDRDLFVKPTGDIAEYLGLRPGQVAILKKSAYGLVQAPRAWHKAVNKTLQELGWTQLEADPCWEYGSFTQCGVDITQRPDFSFSLSQKTYLEQIEEIEVLPDRRGQVSSPVTTAEKSQFRAATGSLQWEGTQTGPDILAELSLLQSKTESCTVEDLLKVNKLIKRAKEARDRTLEIFAFEESQELAVVGWGDAAFANRIDGKSTEGRIIGVVPASFLDGQETGVSLMSWRSGRVERTRRSPLAAEVSATVNTEDEVTYVRFLLSELSGWKPDLRNPWAQVRRVPGVLITDSKNLYDRLRCPEKLMGGKEFRTGLELLASRNGIEACECPVR
ncbi:unnamed protein product [Prorocentrum cordatum]|uniref:Integrase catalytic domain-containing protein n=1 Tax=Prorocentrum cordatum TaxID=2364126 RepID=A0ABN9QDV2_9DINO|nr:unnamed protein product [Polarella glacialis]